MSNDLQHEINVLVSVAKALQDKGDVDSRVEAHNIWCVVLALQNRAFAETLQG